jgi:hypothetical protein
MRESSQVHLNLGQERYRRLMDLAVQSGYEKETHFLRAVLGRLDTIAENKPFHVRQLVLTDRIE